MMETKEMMVKTQSSSFERLIFSGDSKERTCGRISFLKNKSEELPLLI
jgi:hypothetical protein